MRESSLRGVAALVLAMALIAACGLTAVAPQVQAHSRHDGSIELYRGTSGPYQVLVAAVPLVGFLEVTVVFEPDTPDAPLRYSPRVVVLVSRNGEQLGPVTAVRSLSTLANEYTAVLEPGESGRWETTVNIDGELGSTTLVLPVTVGQSSGFPWVVLIAGIGIVLPILWLAFVPSQEAASCEGERRVRTLAR